MLKSAAIPSARPYALGYRLATPDPIPPTASTQTPGQQPPASSAELAAPPEFIAIGSTMRRLLLQLQAVGPLTPLASFEGESGTGKHLLALTLHHRSSVAAQPFRRADASQWLASDPEPDALRGSLYLERADHLSPTGQALLLHLLKTLEDRNPADRNPADRNPADQNSPNRSIPGFQLLVASHASLRHLAAQGLYLADLAFRLSAVRFSLPPLRDHREDIAALTQALIARICRRYHRPPAALAPGALPRLLQHGWPGNVRELSSQLESAILATTDGQLAADRFDLPVTRPVPQPITTNAAISLDDHPADLSLDTVIQRHIQRTLDLYRGNKLRAARQLGISRSTLYRLLAGKSPLTD